MCLVCRERHRAAVLRAAGVREYAEAARDLHATEQDDVAVDLLVLQFTCGSGATRTLYIERV